ncbi:MAG: hypothetical protein AABW50_04230 [Nanoarchaeota archaeon]
MKTFFFLGFGTMLFILAGVLTISFWYDFTNNCEDYLKLAGDAPTVEKANEFLGKALGFLENNGLTSGNSAFFFKKPDADIGIWYNQIKGAYSTTQDILERMRNSASPVSQLEKDNALMKIREVVLDAGKNGVEVTVPAHISWFPHQLLMLFLWTLSVGFIIFGFAILIEW